ncbi:MAG: hypothetical protein ABJC28_04875 [Acidobacteriota bacterium]
MLISLVPLITGMKIENAWGRGSRGMVRCTARLSRTLGTRESRRIEGLAGATLHANEVIHECRPEEVEDWRSLLSDVLRGAWVASVRRVAQVAGPKARRDRKRPRPDPAA